MTDQLQVLARGVLKALNLGSYGPLSDEDLSELARMAQPPVDEQAAATAGEEPGLAPSSEAP